MEKIEKVPSPAPPSAEVTKSTKAKGQVATPERAENSIHVGTVRGPKFYSRLGSIMLNGSGGRPPKHEEILMTGLGLATRCAISAACIMEREKTGTIRHIETSYFASTRVTPSRVPKITITIVRNTNANKVEENMNESK